MQFPILRNIFSLLKKTQKKHPFPLTNKQPQKVLLFINQQTSKTSRPYKQPSKNTFPSTFKSHFTNLKKKKLQQCNNINNIHFRKHFIIKTQ